MTRLSHSSIDNHTYTKTYRSGAPFAILAVMLLSIACGPSSVGLGESGESESSGGLDDGPVFCVEDVPVTTCWVAWGEDSARVMKACEVKAAMAAGAFGDPVEDVLDRWGGVTCHSIANTDDTLCLWGDSNIVLILGPLGWEPIVSETAESEPGVAAPC